MRTFTVTQNRILNIAVEPIIRCETTQHKKFDFVYAGFSGLQFAAFWTLILINALHSNTATKTIIDSGYVRDYIMA